MVPSTDTSVVDSNDTQTSNSGSSSSSHGAMEVEEEGITASAAPMTTTATHGTNVNSASGGGPTEAASVVTADAAKVGPPALKVSDSGVKVAAVDGGEGSSTPRVGMKRSSEEMRAGTDAVDASGDHAAIRPRRDSQDQVQHAQRPQAAPSQGLQAAPSQRPQAASSQGLQAAPSQRSLVAPSQGLQAAHTALAAPRFKPLRNPAVATRQVAAHPANTQPLLAPAAAQPAMAAAATPTATSPSAGTAHAPLGVRNIPDDVILDAAGRSANLLATKEWASCTSVHEMRKRIVVLEEALGRSVEIY